ncbi:MAG: FGGY-family carbohydrate kinase [bacterium]
MSLLGIDVGTTGCKAAAFSLTGNCIASSYREYRTVHPQQDLVELDSEEVMAAIWSVIKHVASKSLADPIESLCVSTMGEAMVPVSANRNILANSILMSDPRGEEYIPELLTKISQKEWYGINPNIIGTNYTLPKILWIRDNQPELYDKTYKFLLWGDLVMFMLGCDPVTSFSHANRTLLFDIHIEDWSEKLLNISGISRDKLPVPLAGGALAGIISNAMADYLNLPHGIKVVVGGHDQCCNSLGAGITKPGNAVCCIGTYECITPTYNKIPDNKIMLESGLNVEHHVLPGLYVSFLYNQGGMLLRWFRDTFASSDKKVISTDVDIYDFLAKEMPDEIGKLLVFPYFEMSGPPNYISDASGTIIGLTPQSTRGEILKAIMECETFYFAELLASLAKMGHKITECVATGGGAKSNEWLQIKADIFGIPFVKPVITEAGVLGAAMLAGIATGHFNNPDEAVNQFVKYSSVFEPVDYKYEQYQHKLQYYNDTFTAIRKYLKPYYSIKKNN